MIRTCPKCGDFYADGPLLFCPADGAPLADLDPRGETWSEASRVVEEKERTLRRLTRRVKARRVLVTTTTVLITTVVVCVVALNAYVYLRPEPDAPVVASALAPPRPKPPTTPEPTQTPPPDGASSLPFVPFVPAVTPTPTPDETKTPDATHHPDSTPTREGTTTPADTSTPTDTTAPTETATVVVEERRTPTPTPTPTPKPTIKETPTPPPPPTPTPAPKCTGDDKSAMRDEIFRSSSAAWEAAIGGEREAIVRAYAPDGVRASIGLLAPVVYSVKFSKACAPVSVTAVYVWRVRWDGAQRPDRNENREPGLVVRDQNREQRQAPAGGDRKVFRTKSFNCWSDGGGWRCG
jgi:hypothetical protein